jgi:hypothetical protein
MDLLWGIAANLHSMSTRNLFLRQRRGEGETGPSGGVKNRMQLDVPFLLELCKVQKTPAFTLRKYRLMGDD